MTRFCASFSNCAPEIVPVTVTNNTYTYEIGGNQIGWRQERFVFGDSNFVATAGSVSVGGVSTAYKAYLELASVPAAQHSVQVFMSDGSVPQRPLIGAAGVPVAGDAQAFDYLVHGNKVFLTFDVVAGDSIFVHYVGAPLARSVGVSTGDMDTIAVAAIDDPSQAPAGWCLADGYTPYSKAAFPDLYAFLLDADLLSLNSVTTNPADGQNLVSHDIDEDTSFVIRYLVPYAYGAQGDDVLGTTHPPRSTTHRVIVKA